MVDVVSIVIAVISLVGSLASAGFTGFITYYIDRIKRRSEAAALVDKYRDPLTLAAYDLQSRCYNITDDNLLFYLSTDDESKHDDVRKYTAFVIGQYLGWVQIFRREAQFLRFSTDPKNRQLNDIMEKIVEVFSKSKKNQKSFGLWRGQQMAIGELMTVKRDHDDQLYCMGYATFQRRYEEDPSFRKWFLTIDDDITYIAKAERSGNREAMGRLRRLQHLLIDLILLTGEGSLSSGRYGLGKVLSAEGCTCDQCPGRR